MLQDKSNVSDAGALASDEPLWADALPQVPSDREAVLEAAKKVTRRVPEASRAEFISGLTEIIERGVTHPGELGDLGPDPVACATYRGEIVRLNGNIARYRALLEYSEAKRAIVEEKGVHCLDDGYDQVTVRIKRGRLPVESYANVRRFGDSHGARVSQGRVRAQHMRAKIAAKAPAPANDTSAPGKTGTNDT